MMRLNGSLYLQSYGVAVRLSLLTDTPALPSASFLPFLSLRHWDAPRIPHNILCVYSLRISSRIEACLFAFQVVILLDRSLHY